MKLKWVRQALSEGGSMQSSGLSGASLQPGPEGWRVLLLWKPVPSAPPPPAALTCPSSAICNDKHLQAGLTDVAILVSTDNSRVYSTGQMEFLHFSSIFLNLFWNPLKGLLGHNVQTCGISCLHLRSSKLFINILTVSPGKESLLTSALKLGLECREPSIFLQLCGVSAQSPGWKKGKVI